jgi:hypothetical protein
VATGGTAMPSGGTAVTDATLTATGFTVS